MEYTNGPDLEDAGMHDRRPFGAWVFLWILLFFGSFYRVTMKTKRLFIKKTHIGPHWHLEGHCHLRAPSLTFARVDFLGNWILCALAGLAGLLGPRGTIRPGLAGP